MLTLIPANFVPQEVTEEDITIASLAWGFTLGFGILTVWHAIKQTKRAIRVVGASRLNSPYIIMIWLEILVCLAFGIICFMHLKGLIPPSFAFYFTILTLWALQVQFLLQIIINRVAILQTNRRRGLYIRLGVAAFITAINISVYCIWIPARLQISQEYIRINDIWDRCEKAIYLVVDACLNWYFIRIVDQNLVRGGLKRYQTLVRFNRMIVFVSLSMDVLIIAMMSLKNSFVYMQFHPLAYIVKLNIEMSMAELIAKVARAKEQNGQEVFQHSSSYQLSSVTNTNNRTKNRTSTANHPGGMKIPSRNTATSPPPPPHGKRLSMGNIFDSKIPNDNGVTVTIDAASPSSSSFNDDINASGVRSSRKANNHSTNPALEVYTKHEIEVQVDSVPGVRRSSNDDATRTQSDHSWYSGGSMTEDDSGRGRAMARGHGHNGSLNNASGDVVGGAGAGQSEQGEEDTLPLRRGEYQGMGYGVNTKIWGS